MTPKQFLEKQDDGYTAGDYTAINTEREDFEYLTILEIVEILEKETVS
jgi:hypothetical protein